MSLTSKQRAYLRSLAVNMDTILTLGKGGMSPEIIKQADDALLKRELIKGRVLPETSPVSPREAAEELAEKTNSQVVQVIGSRFVLYRKHPKEPKIILPKAKKQ
jgi:RNA-binding protein